VNRVIELKDKTIEHKKWGVGSVIEQSDCYIKIAFLSVGIKQFQYPEAFENFLKCSDIEIHNQILAELAVKKNQEAEKRIKLQKEREEAVKIQEHIVKNVSDRKKTYPKENIAFKCNFCDGGNKENGIGYKYACSDELINYNIEVAQHNWCCSEDCPCSQYYNGIINRKTLDKFAEEDGFVCYESQMLKNWAAFAGFALTKENNQKPMKLNKVQINSLAILTTRVPYTPEKERFVFGVFLVDEAYEGDNRDEGYVTTSSKYKLSLSLDEAKKILFWNYYHNENAPEKIAWGQGLHRYITDVQSACILRDVVQLKANTSEEELAKGFLDYFCKMNGLDVEELPKLDGALKR
jgi:hypothetical protein